MTVRLPHPNGDPLEELSTIQRDARTEMEFVTNETSDLTTQIRQTCNRQVKLQRAHGGCLGTEKR